MVGLVTIYEPSAVDGALRQGEIITGLVQAYVALDSVVSGTQPEVESKTHQWAVVVSQDCDLDWDHRSRQSGTTARKSLPNVLFCEMIDALTLRNRPAEATAANVPRREINSEMWNRISNNKDERYHFLQRVSPQEDRLGEGLPELAIDFKRYFTIPTEEVYHRLGAGAHRRCCLRSPYMEHLSSRFCYYQSRVALPEDHFSEPAAPGTSAR